MGMSNGIGTIAGLICPIAIDHITRDEVSTEQMSNIFQPLPYRIGQNIFPAPEHKHNKI